MTLGCALLGVRGRNDGDDPLLRGDAPHRDGSLHVVRAIVQGGDNVGVDIYHGLERWNVRTFERSNLLTIVLVCALVQGGVVQDHAQEVGVDLAENVAGFDGEVAAGLARVDHQRDAVYTGGYYRSAGDGSGGWR